MFYVWLISDMTVHERTLQELKNGLCGQKLFMNDSFDDYETAVFSQDSSKTYDENGFSTCVPENSLRIQIVKPAGGNTYVKMIDEAENIYYLTTPMFSMKTLYNAKFVAYAFTYFDNGTQVLSFYDYMQDFPDSTTQTEGVLARVTKLHCIISGMCLGENAVFRFHWCGQEKKCVEIYRENQLPWDCAGVFRMDEENVGRLTRVVL